MRSHKPIHASAWNMQSLKAFSPPGGIGDMVMHHQKSVMWIRRTPGALSQVMNLSMMSTQAFCQQGQHIQTPKSPSSWLHRTPCGYQMT